MGFEGLGRLMGKWEGVSSMVLTPVTHPLAAPAPSWRELGQLHSLPVPTSGPCHLSGRWGSGSSGLMVWGPARPLTWLPGCQL